MLLQSLALIAAIGSRSVVATDNDKVYKHVVTFSVDGLHSSDVPKYVALRPKSTIAALLETGYEYTDCYTSAPVTYDETKDYDSTKLWSGGIDPANLPQSIINGKCTWTYPHQRIRVNTIYEAVHEAGLQTAYTDKHPAYDLVRGPSGKGLSVGYFLEIQSSDTTNLSQIIRYDELHVNTWLAWVAGTELVNSEVQEPLTGIPTLFGGNFQAVSVGQKSYGYIAGSLDFTPELTTTLDFVDASIGKVVDALKATDDVGLVFLSDIRDTDQAVDNLNKQRDALKISDIISGDRLTYEGYGDPATDPAVPHIIIVPEKGNIYTTSTSKIAEHGGLSIDDRQVACFASATNLQKAVFDHQVHTQEFAPTILQALGLDPATLKGAAAENIGFIDGFKR